MYSVNCPVGNASKFCIWYETLLMYFLGKGVWQFFFLISWAPRGSFITGFKFFYSQIEIWIINFGGDPGAKNLCLT